MGFLKAWEVPSINDCMNVWQGLVNFAPSRRAWTRVVGPSVVIMLFAWMFVGSLNWGCSSLIEARSGAGVWRASDDYGDKPGSGIELELNSGKLSGRYYILEPEKSDDFASGGSFPMTLSKRSSTEFICEVSFNPAEVDKFVLKLPGKFPDEEFVATTTDTEPGAEPIEFKFRKIK